MFMTAGFIFGWNEVDIAVWAGCSGPFDYDYRSAFALLTTNTNTNEDENGVRLR
jgi:hypothetical protein